MREGSLEAPTRYPIRWDSDDWYDEDKLYTEMERIFDICHGCRRCVNLCNTFPTLFDLVDESETMEIDGVDKADYMKVVDNCYLCDICFSVKCPYVPPHEWEVDFPHLMLRAKSYKYRKQGAGLRDRVISNTDSVGRAASIPVVDVTVNALNGNTGFRKALENTAGIHHEAPLPKYHSNTMRRRAKRYAKTIEPTPAGDTTGKVALFLTCHGNYNSPEIGEDFFRVFQHNGIHIEAVPREVCCGMPRFELGDLQTVAAHKEKNIPVLADLVDKGYDITASIPSCVLMFKQELPLMFPGDEQVQKVQRAFYDPFEYLFLRHKAGLLNTDFRQSLGDISYHVACHMRVQNIGYKTRDILNLVPDTQVQAQERCSGHDGTYAVKVESRDNSVKIARPLVRRLDQQQGQHLISDCPLAATQIGHLSEQHETAQHPMTLLRMAYGL